MTPYHKVMLSFFCLIMSFTSVVAELPNHYIIAFDRAIPRYRLYYEINNILNINLFTAGNM